MRLSALYLNSINSISVKYKFLQNCSVYDEVEYKGNKGPLKQILIQVKDEEDKLFSAVEQGVGKNALKVFVLMKPTKRSTA